MWEKQEVTLKAQNSYPTPYLSVDVWVDLVGPGFRKRVYGFWDGGNTFRVRVLATAVGKWSWKSGSNPADPGLSGKSGSFEAVAWSEAEKQANPNRRGFVRATPNKHALEYADGTPYFLSGDVWTPVGTWRFPWFDDDKERPIGPEAGFKDYVRFRKSQGYNLIAMIASYPGWGHDGYPATIMIEEGDKKIMLRGAWREAGTNCCGPDTPNSPKDMHNEGGLPFEFPGRVPGYEKVYPDVTRINPAYFQAIDRKMDYMNEQGFVVFMEALRRDVSQAWRRYYPWPDSYTRYLLYLYTRYGANNVILSPIHLDMNPDAMPAAAFLPAINLLYEKYGPPPFENLSSTNTSPSTLVMWGQPGMNSKFLTVHQTGNVPRDHTSYAYQTEIFFASPTLPTFPGESYWSGWPSSGWPEIDGAKMLAIAPGGSETDSRFMRSSMFGNFLSGALAGHLHGSFGICWGDIEPGVNQPALPDERLPRIPMWDAFRFDAASYMSRLRAFALSQGKRYQELIPDDQLVLPNSTHEVGWDGWAFAAATKERDFVLVYWEKGCPTRQLRSLRAYGNYEAKWFDPRKGEWSDVGSGTLTANISGWISMPKLPTDDDWGMRLVLKDVTAFSGGPAPPAGTPK
jgi:hypothetical protein